DSGRRTMTNWRSTTLPGSPNLRWASGSTMSIFPRSKVAKANPLFLLALFVSSLFLLSSNAMATSLLNNPGFELDPPGQNQNVLSWQLYGPNTYSESNAALAHAGTNYFKVYTTGNSTVNYNGCYQDYISGPGATYSADGWAYTATADAIDGQNQAW